MKLPNDIMRGVERPQIVPMIHSIMGALIPKQIIIIPKLLLIRSDVHQCRYDDGCTGLQRQIIMMITGQRDEPADSCTYDPGSGSWMYG